MVNKVTHGSRTTGYKVEKLLNSEIDIKGAAVKFPPPLIFLLVLTVTTALDYFYPLGLGGSTVPLYAGILVFPSGVVVAFLALRNFKRAKTNIEPWKPTRKIVSSGIYGYTRNPMYLAFCLGQTGIGLMVNSLWFLVGSIVLGIFLYHIAIKKEEAYLEKKFGEDYILYKNRVRRWF